MDQLQGLVFFFFEQLSMSFVLEVWCPNREQSKIFKAIFVLSLFATRSLIFIRNAKLVHRRQPYPTISIVRCYRMCEYLVCRGNVDFVKL
jgi:hypothetical protein